MPSAAFSGFATGLAQGAQFNIQAQQRQQQLDTQEGYLRLQQDESRRRQEAISRDIEQARLSAEADAETLRARFQTPVGQQVAGQMSEGSLSPEDEAARRIQTTLRASMGELGEAFPAVARAASSAMETMPLPGASRYIEQTVDRVRRMTRPEARAQFLNDVNMFFGSQLLQREMAQAQMMTAKRYDTGGYADVQIGPDGSIGMVTDPAVKAELDQQFNAMTQLAQSATTTSDIDALRGGLRVFLQNEQQGREQKRVRNQTMLTKHQEVQRWGKVAEANADNPELANMATARMLDVMHGDERFSEAAEYGLKMPPMSSPKGGGHGPPPPGGEPPPPDGFYPEDVSASIRRKGGDPNMAARKEYDAARNFGVDAPEPELEAPSTDPFEKAAAHLGSMEKSALVAPDVIDRARSGEPAAQAAMLLAALREGQRLEPKKARELWAAAVEGVGKPELKNRPGFGTKANKSNVAKQVLAAFGFGSFRDLEEALGADAPE